MSVHSPPAAVAVGRVVLVVANWYPGAGQGVELPEVEQEALQYEAAIIAAGGRPVMLRNVTVQQFQFALEQERAHTVVFCGHGDAHLGTEGGLALAFVANNGLAAPLDVVDHHTMANMLLKLGGDRLRLLMLQGCCTSALALRLRRGGSSLRYIVCWASRTVDEAARAFGISFLQRCLSAADDTASHIQAAFEGGKADVVTKLRMSFRLATGHPSNVPKYQLVDPDDRSTVDPQTCQLRDGSGSIAGGVPELVHVDVRLPEALLIGHTHVCPPIKRIGHGAYGQVHLVRCRGVQMAAKSLHPEPGLGDADAQLERALLKEARIMADVAHPNVVRLFHVCVEPGHVMLLMEYAERGSLLRVLREHPDLPLCTALQEPRGRIALLYDAALGMQALHAHQPRPILHGDLKTANLLVTHDWRCKLADFGFATGVGSVSAAAQSTNGTGVGGTIAYQPPERWQAGALSLSDEDKMKGDVYAFAVTLCEVVSGAQPFAGIAPFDVMAAVVHRKERPTLPDDCPHIIREIISTSWAHEPQQRPHFGDVSKRLRHVRELGTITPGTPRSSSPVACELCGKQVTNVRRHLHESCLPKTIKTAFSEGNMGEMRRLFSFAHKGQRKGRGAQQGKPWSEVVCEAVLKKIPPSQHAQVLSILVHTPAAGVADVDMMDASPHRPRLSRPAAKGAMTDVTAPSPTLVAMRKAKEQQRERAEAAASRRLDEQLHSASGASGQPNPHAVKMLLRQGANPNATLDTCSALHAAAWAGSPEVVKLLIEHGANVNAARADNSGTTPLDCAQGHPNPMPGHMRVVELLQSHGAIKSTSTM